MFCVLICSDARSYYECLLIGWLHIVFKTRTVRHTSRLYHSRRSYAGTLTFDSRMMKNAFLKKSNNLRKHFHRKGTYFQYQRGRLVYEQIMGHLLYGLIYIKGPLVIPRRNQLGKTRLTPMLLQSVL